MSEIFPDKLYISALGIVFLMLIYAPIIFLVLLTIWNKTKFKYSSKVILMIGLILVFIAIPLGDVYRTSVSMKRACTAEAGTHIYKTVKADGFNDKGILWESSLDDGYKFVEGPRKGKLLRLEKTNGEVVQTEIKEPSSRYRYAESTSNWISGVSTVRYMIIDSVNDEVLAERVNFGAKPGWIDRYIALRWFGFNYEYCNLPYFDGNKFFTSVLIPNKN